MERIAGVLLLVAVLLSGCGGGGEGPGDHHGGPSSGTVDIAYTYPTPDDCAAGVTQDQAVTFSITRTAEDGSTSKVEGTTSSSALLVADADFTPDWVRSTLVGLLQDRAAIAEMAVRAGTVGVLDGTDRTVELVREAVREAPARADHDVPPRTQRHASSRTASDRRTDRTDRTDAQTEKASPERP